jgi:hypothetical protein
LIVPQQRKPDPNLPLKGSPGPAPPGKISPRVPPRLLVTVTLALLTAGGSWWLIARAATIQCDSLAPLTVLATLAAFLISICFRQMGRFADRRSRWVLLGCILIAAATLFTDFRFVRRYRDVCDEIRQQITPTPPAH